MRLDKKFLATLLGVDESEIPSISGMTFELSSAPEGGATFKSLIHDRHIKRAKALGAVLTTDDDLGKVVRAHIYIEHELQDFIFFAAPSSAHLKRFDQMEFSEKVRLALVLALNAELQPALNAVGNLRNKFSHRLDTKLGEDEAKNLIATLSRPAKQRFQALLKSTLAGLPSTASLTGEGLSYFRAQSQVMVFFLALFDEVARERHRLAFEKLHAMAWQ
jgi:hypothetical protein